MASIRIIGKILAEQPGNGRCHWQKASGIYRFDFVVGVGKLELPASCSQTVELNFLWLFIVVFNHSCYISLTL